MGCLPARASSPTRFLSGLRGAADIDGDRRIEYSELAAFLTAANRNVTESPRARPTTLVRPPARHPRAAVVEAAQTDRNGWLVGRPSALGPLYVEDARGNPLCSLHAEPGHRVALLLPTGI